MIEDDDEEDMILVNDVCLLLLMLDVTTVWTISQVRETEQTSFFDDESIDLVWVFCVSEEFTSFSTKKLLKWAEKKRMDDQNGWQGGKAISQLSQLLILDERPDGKDEWSNEQALPGFSFACEPNALSDIFSFGITIFLRQCSDSKKTHQKNHSQQHGQNNEL